MSTKTDTATGLAATAAAGKTFDTVLAELAQPFDPEAVEFKAGATTQDKARALALAYVDSRVYQGRLDAVTPDWRNEYTREYVGDRVIVTCALTVAGVTRQAIGESLQASARHDGSTVIEENAATSAEAQAFKRACSAFGLGRYLYSVPQVWAEYDAQRRQFTPAARPGPARDAAHGQVRARGQAPRQPRCASGGNGNSGSGPTATARGPARQRRRRRRGATPACPKCGGAMWDNRASRRNPRRPDLQVQEGRLRWGHLAADGPEGVPF